MNKLFSQLICFFLLIIIISYSLFYYSNKWIYLTNETQRITQNIHVFKERIFFLNTEIRRALAEEELAAELIFSNRKEDFLTFFDFIDNSYGFKDIHYNIRDPEIIASSNQYSFFRIIFTEVFLTFKCDSEMKLYAFLEEISEKIPGYVYINHLKLLKQDGFFDTEITLNVYTVKEVAD